MCNDLIQCKELQSSSEYTRGPIFNNGRLEGLIGGLEPRCANIGAQVNTRNPVESRHNNNDKIKITTDFDYDIVFLCGLNANFTKSWRIPEDSETNLKDIMHYYLKGINKDKVFNSPAYRLWIPQMLEKSTFNNHKIRYTVTCCETKFYTSDISKLGIPDYSMDDMADGIFNSFKNAGIGKRPVVLVCHSMGGLIAKKVIEKISNSDSFSLDNIKGVVFYSTPHFGSDAISSIIKLAIKKYFKYFKIFETTSSDYGLNEEDIIKVLADYQFTQATKDVSFTPLDELKYLHEKFREKKLKYICINEADMNLIKFINEYTHIVKPESSYLPEVDNYILKGKCHGDLHKYSRRDEEGYKILSEFIKESLKI